MTRSEYQWCYKYVKKNISRIVEVGSRDGMDALALARKFGAEVIAFECDPRLISICFSNISADNEYGSSIELRSEALSDHSDVVTFWQIEDSMYKNPGAGSLFEINFSNRSKNDPDRGLTGVQRPVQVEAKRFDELDITPPDLLVMDVQGAELKVMHGFGLLLQEINYVVLEAEPVSSYEGGCNLEEIFKFMKKAGFKFAGSDIAGLKLWHLKLRLFVRSWRLAIQERTLFPHKIHLGIVNLIFESKNGSLET